MADDASLERFLADAGPLRTARGFDPVLAFRLLSAAEFGGDAALSSPLDEARKAGVVAVATPTARNAAIARYALERVAIAVEGQVGSASRASVANHREPRRRGLR